jgi:hypothetical protein
VFEGMPTRIRVRAAWISRVFAVAALALSLASVAGCGSDKKNEPKMSAEKKAFIAKTDAACKRVYKKTDAKTAQFRDQNPQPTPAKAASFLASMVPIAKSGVKEIRAPKAPAADAAQIQKISDAVDAGLAKIEKAAKDPNLAKGVMAGGNDPFSKARKLASAYGLHGCARD